MAKPSFAKKAVHAGDPAALAMALEGRGSRAAASQTESDGRPLLAYAVAGKSGDSGSAQCVQLLIAAGADPSAHDTHGQSALHWACRFGRSLCSRVLIEAGADIHAATTFEYTPLGLAILGASLNATKLLIDRGASLHAPCAKEFAALDYARKLIGQPNENDQTRQKREAVAELIELHICSGHANAPRKAASI